MAFQIKTNAEVASTPVKLVEPIRGRWGYTSPAVRLYAILSGPWPYPTGSYRIGFIQGIIEYELVVQYEDFVLDISPPVPIRDGASGPLAPWYEQPLIGQRRQRQYEHILIQIGDAPQANFELYGTGPGVGRPNPFRRMYRRHRFRTFLVIADMQNNIKSVPSMIEWEHKIAVYAEKEPSVKTMKVAFTKPSPICNDPPGGQLARYSPADIPPEFLAPTTANAAALEAENRAIRPKDAIALGPDDQYDFDFPPLTIYTMR